MEFTISPPTPPPSGKGKAPETPRQKRSGRPTASKVLSPDLGLDLTASVTTAADEFLHDELDAYQEAELDRSIRESLVLSQNDPFTTDDDGLPGAFPSASNIPSTGEVASDPPLAANVESTTVLAGVIERVLSRLNVKVQRVKIRLHNPGYKNGGTFELSIGEMQYTEETSPASEETPRSVARVVSVGNVEVYYSRFASTSSSASAPRSTLSARSSSVSSASTSSTVSQGSEDDNADMMMSLAVADLRQSVAASSVAGDSVYESALSEQEEEDEEEFPRQMEPPTLSGIGRDSLASESRSRSLTPRGQAVIVEEDPRELVSSLGKEDLIMRFKTSRPTLPPPTAKSQGQGTPSASGTTTAPPPLVQVDVNVPAMTCLLEATHLGCVLSTVRTLSAFSQEPQAAGPPIFGRIQPRLEVKIDVGPMVAAIIYEMDPVRNVEYDGAVRRFWSQPAAVYLPIGHLKLRLESLNASYTLDPRSQSSTSQRAARQVSTTQSATTTASAVPPSDASSIFSLSITDVNIFEYVSSAQSDSGATPGGIFPVVIFDSNLSKQYELPSDPFSVSSQGGSTIGIGTSEQTFPAYDTFDWRDVNYQRKGLNDKIWKVRPRGRGALKQPIKDAPPSPPVISVRKDLSGNSAAQVNLESTHLFLDLSLIERSLPMLRSIAPSMRRSHSTATSPTILTPTTTKAPRGLHTALDDIQLRPSAQQDAISSEVAVIACPMIRMDIRCPAPPKKRGTWGDSVSLRSGIVTLDVHRVKARLSGPSSSGDHAAAPSMTSAKALGSVDCQKAVVLFCRAPGKLPSSLLS